MPRPPTYHHPLRKIRACTDCTSQKRFAAMLGVSTPTVQAIENGKLALSPRLARRIRRITGADDAELMKGDKGRAVTVFGQTYTEKFFEQWKQANQGGDDLGTLEDPAFWLDTLANAALESEEPERFYGVKATLIEAVDAACYDGRLQDRVEDALIPYQQVENLTLPALKWRAADPAIRNWFGFDGIDGPDISGALPLRLVRQTTPAWSPGGPVPKSAEGPAEMPGRYLTVGVGQAGCLLAEQFSRVLCKEHGIDETDGRPLKFGPAGYHRGFFHEVESGKRWLPRVFFADLEPTVPNGISERSPELFPAHNLWTQKDGSGNSYAEARQKGGDEFSQELEQFVSRECRTGALEGVILFMAVSGGTGSGLGTLALEWFKARFPEVPVLVVAVLPPEKGGRIVTAPYNSVLALSQLKNQADLALLIENEALLENGRTFWNVLGHAESEMNRVAAHLVAALTSILRFESETGRRRTMEELIQQSRLPQSPFLTGEMVPWMKIMGRRVKDAALSTLMRQFWQKACRGRVTEHHLHLLQVIFRGRKLAQPIDELPAAFELSEKQDAKLDVLRAAEDRFRLTGRVDPDVEEDAAIFYNSGQIGEWMGPILEQFDSLWSRRAFLQSYTDGGIVEMNMEASAGAVESIRAIYRG